MNIGLINRIQTSLQRKKTFKILDHPNESVSRHISDVYGNASKIVRHDGEKIFIDLNLKVECLSVFLPPTRTL